MLHLLRLEEIHGDIANEQGDYNTFVRESDGKIMKM